MRKSKTPAKMPNGNAAKYLSYREAWARINAGRRNGFHFEAVTLLESILSDRLISYLLVVGELEPLEVSKKKGFGGFAQLIVKWKCVHPDPIAAGRFDNLQDAVDAWRENRNITIHEVVRVEAGATIMRIDQFLIRAEQASAEGVDLAKAFCGWCKKTVRARMKNSSRALVAHGH